MRRDHGSLAERVGRLFMVGFEGTEVTPELADWLATFGWAGVILFGRNVQSPAQLLRLTQGLQEAAGIYDHHPLLVAVDQEGGRVGRLQTPFTAFPSAATVGRTGSEQLAREVGFALGKELRAVGINMDMAPVLDVLTNPANTVIGDRAYSSDPQRVAGLGVAFIRGLHAAGVLAVAKHFPGHGDTLLDSHVAQPSSARLRAQMQACELVPFREAIAAGVDAIMTAHVVYPDWDAQAPATLSPTILTQGLRREWGFQGVIVTDDLGMAAVSATLPWEEIHPRALCAGADLLLVCHDRQRQEQAHASVVQAVRDGRLSEEVIDRAGARLRGLRERLTHPQSITPSPVALACIGSEAHQALVEALHVRSERSTSST